MLLERELEPLFYAFLQPLIASENLPSDGSLRKGRVVFVADGRGFPDD